MKTITTRFIIAKSWPSVLVPRVKLLLVKVEISTRGCIVTPTSRGIFELVDGVISLTVDLNKHHCDCMEWDITSIPCKHEARFILGEGLTLSLLFTQYTPSKVTCTHMM